MSGKKRPTIGVVAICYNEEENLAGFLNSLIPWVDEIVLVDDGSTDRTYDMVRNTEFDITWVSSPRKPGEFYSHQRNKGIDASTSDWLLHMDVDERVPQSLAGEIVKAIRNEKYDAYRLRRLNFFFHRPIRAGGWEKWNMVHLARRDTLRFEGMYHEEHVVHAPPERIGQVKSRIWHLNDKSYLDRMKKSVTYCVEVAEKIERKGSKVRPYHLITAPAREFVARYLFKGGWRDGSVGFLLALHSADAQFRAYALVWDRRNRIQRDEIEETVRSEWQSYLNTKSNNDCPERSAIAMDVSDNAGDRELVSVVLPTHNRAIMLCEALDGVWHQTYRPIEVIVVDDGSEDATRDAVERWTVGKESDVFKIRYVYQENQGSNPARNRGIREATGKYVAFLDSDDFWYPEKLDQQMAVFRKETGNLAAVYCGIRTKNLDTGEKGPVLPRPYPSGSLLPQLLIRDVTAPTSTYVIRKEALKAVDFFDESLPVRQDWDLYIRIAERYQIGVVPQVLVELGEHSGERVRSNLDKEVRGNIRLYEKHAALRATYSPTVRLSARANLYRKLGRKYYHSEGAHLKALSMHVRSIVVWPFAFDSYAAILGMAFPSAARRKIHLIWNRCLGKTPFEIRSH